MSEPFSSPTTGRAPSGAESPSIPVPPDQLSQLIKGVAAKDRSAFAALYEATAPKLLGTIIRILNNRGWAEEVVHDTYIKIWRKADQFDASKPLR